ncbi:hypothetical protein [Rhodococcus triatomae]
MTTDDPGSLLASLGIDVEQMPLLPDDVWERALDRALDPTTELADASLVPEMDDTPILPEDDDLDIDLDGIEGADADTSTMSDSADTSTMSDSADTSAMSDSADTADDIDLGPTLADDADIAIDYPAEDPGAGASDLGAGHADEGGF